MNGLLVFIEMMQYSKWPPKKKVIFQLRQFSIFFCENFMDCTEVGSAPLIHFKKLFWNKVFYTLKLVRKFKFYTWMTLSGSKSVKKGQKMLKKATIWSYTWFFWKNCGLANLIHINSYNMRKKMWCHCISLWVIFSHLVKLKHHFRIYSQQLSTTS